MTDEVNHPAPAPESDFVEPQIPTYADDPESEETPDDDEQFEPAPPIRRRRRRIVPRALRDLRVITVILVVLLLISGGAATWLYFKQYRPAQQTDSQVAATVKDAASDATVALLSYSSDSLEQDFANARSHLYGEFLAYYNDFTQQMVAPAAKEKSLKTTARVTGAAVSELRPDSATVLIFVDQTTTTKDSPQPTLSLNSVLVRMSRVDGNWLITKFTPV